MAAIADLHVWIDTYAEAERRTVVPYVKTAREMHINYRLNVTQKSRSGTSAISQSGQVDTQPAKPAALSQLNLVPGKGATCEIVLVLNDGQKELGRYVFDCL